MPQIVKPRIRHDARLVASLEPEIVERVLGQWLAGACLCKHAFAGSRVGKSVQQRASVSLCIRL